MDLKGCVTVRFNMEEQKYHFNEDSLIVQGLEKITDWIDDIDIAFLKGLAYFGLLILVLLFVYWTGKHLWFWNWGRLAFVYGGWILSEIINRMGY